MGRLSNVKHSKTKISKLYSVNRFYLISNNLEHNINLLLKIFPSYMNEKDILQLFDNDYTESIMYNIGDKIIHNDETHEIIGTK